MISRNLVPIVVGLLGFIAGVAEFTLARAPASSTPWTHARATIERALESGDVAAAEPSHA